MTKREIERAINIITAYYQFAKADFSVDETQAFEAAIAALCEVLEREKGCEMCKGNAALRSEPYDDLLEVQGHELVVISEGYPELRFDVSHCLNCGRKLEEFTP